MKTKKIRSHGTIKPTSGGTAHISEFIRKELEHPPEIPYVADAHIVVLFNPNKTPEEILKSVEAIKKAIELRIEEIENDTNSS